MPRTFKFNVVLMAYPSLLIICWISYDLFKTEYGLPVIMIASKPVISSTVGISPFVISKIFHIWLSNIFKKLATKFILGLKKLLCSTFIVTNRPTLFVLYYTLIPKIFYRLSFLLMNFSGINYSVFLSVIFNKISKKFC